jgi:amino acid transporter
VVPIAFFVASLLGTVVVSYRQTVRSYPSGGGAYIVAHKNLGMYPGLLVTAALLIDYVLIVSVLIVAGVDAIVSTSPGISALKIPISIIASCSSRSPTCAEPRNRELSSPFQRMDSC